MFLTQEDLMGYTDIISTDVLIIGAGVAGLSSAIELANRLKRKDDKKRILLLDKGENIGSHILSGAIIEPKIFKTLLNSAEYFDIPFDTKVTEETTLKLNAEDEFEIPIKLPQLSNEDNYIASLGEVCRYLAKVAEKKGVEIYTGFAVEKLIYDKKRVAGVKLKDTGVSREGKKLKNYQAGNIVEAKVIIFAEGSRGHLTKKLIDRFDLDEGKNPQIYSLGVKELWSVPEGNIKAGEIYHTIGFPLEDKREFGGGFIYGLSKNRVALGLVVGLDYENPKTDIHALMQVWKTHPFVSKFLEGGELLEFGAKTIPEGGWNSIPKSYGENFLIVGDGAGFLSTLKLKGVHLAVESGISAGKAVANALILDDISEDRLAYYEKLIESGNIYKELYPIRDTRAVMRDGMILGGLKVAMQLLTKSSFFGVPELEPDMDRTKKVKDCTSPSTKERFEDRLDFDGKLTYDKESSVFYSHLKYDENQPVHLIINNPEEFKKSNIEQFGLSEEYFCPARVYELHEDSRGEKSFRIHAENCIHCKTCDIKSPNGGITWTPPYGADGPNYNYM